MNEKSKFLKMVNSLRIDQRQYALEMPRNSSLTQFFVAVFIVQFEVARFLTDTRQRGSASLVCQTTQHFVIPYYASMAWPINHPLAFVISFFLPDHISFRITSRQPCCHRGARLLFSVPGNIESCTPPKLFIAANFSDDKLISRPLFSTSPRLSHTLLKPRISGKLLLNQKIFSCGFGTHRRYCRIPLRMPKFQDSKFRAEVFFRTSIYYSPYLLTNNCEVV